MHRCRHDLDYGILSLCKVRPLYVAELSKALRLKYPTIRPSIQRLVYRYSLTPLNPDGTPAFDTSEPANEGKVFLYDTRHYPYFITKFGELYLKQLETLMKVDRLEREFLTEDFKRFVSIKEGDDSILIKPNRFMKPKARTVPKNEPKKPTLTHAVTMTDEEFERLRHNNKDSRQLKRKSNA
jgi:hypothetical protein